MLSPERRIDTLRNPNQNAVVGIEHINPNKFGKSYWRDFLQWQIDNDGKRLLSFLIVHPDKGGEKSGLKTFSLMDIRRQVQGLPETERDNFLSGIIEEILQSEQVWLTETDEKKFIPNNENFLPQKTHALSDAELQRLIGNLSSPEVSPIITVKNPTDLETQLILKQQSENRSKIRAEWDISDGNGTSTVPLIVDLSYPRTPSEIEKLSRKLTGAHRLSIISS